MAEEEKISRKDPSFSRRDMIKATAGAVVAAPLIALDTKAAVQKTARKRGQKGATAAKQKAPLFFTPEEFKLVDELTELIIPADEHSPGAREAGVTAYIDARLAESFEPKPKTEWREGLKNIDKLSTEMHDKSFMASSPDERVALLTRIAKNEREPKTPEEVFFKELKSRTVHAYYTSKIGIHTEMEYKGNTYLKEFVGYDAT